MSARMKGTVCMILSAASFSLMNVFVRMAGDLPSMQKSFFRNAISLTVALFMILRSHTRFEVAPADRKHLLVRSLAGTFGILCNYYAVDHILLSDATVLIQLSPFFTVLFAGWLLKERIKPVQAMLFVIAFSSVLLILKPSMTGFVSMGALVALAGGVFAGLAYAEVRLLGQHGVDRTIIIFTFSAVSCLVTLPALVFHYVPMNGQQLAFLLLAGLAASGGQFGITYAYFYAPASEISVYDYAQVLFASVFGYFFFDQVADRFSILGYVIIIAAAVAMAAYNRRNTPA